MKKIILSTFLCVTCFLVSLSAQQEGWEAGLWLGASHYFGDLNTSYNLSQPGPAGGLFARKNFNKRTALKFGASYGRVQADDALSRNIYERVRNLSFQSDIIEGNVALEFNFLPYQHGSDDEFFTPYVFGGFSFFSFNPTAEYEGVAYNLRDLGTEGQFQGEEYSTFSGGLLYGLGFKIDINYEWSINIEIGARQLFTDYLDDVSTSYPDQGDLENLRGEVAVGLSDPSIIVPGVNETKIGEEGRQRGNSNNNDSYVMLGVGIVYFFGDIRCPKYGRK